MATSTTSYSTRMKHSKKESSWRAKLLNSFKTSFSVEPKMEDPISSMISL
jgi:hypothetical protein